MQVTATPYSLYLQPKIINVNQVEYEPMKPEFTKILPVHDKYIGGIFYFETSEDISSPASDLFMPIPVLELKKLSKRHGAYLNSILTTNNLKVFRSSIVNYIVGASIRIIQENNKMQKEGVRRPVHKSACIMHTDVSKGIHRWQGDLVSALIKSMATEIARDPNLLDDVFKDAYDNLTISITKSNLYLPAFEEVKLKSKEAILDEEISIKIVNSDNDIVALLNESGQLRLDNPYNVFIGGSILDRGLTIDNLIGFFYGRNPYSFQQDTVLQHSRMYGARSKEDIAVSRFYTSNRIYGAMKRMYFFDKALRSLIENSQSAEIVKFIYRSKSGDIKPCGLNKVKISNLELIKPGSRSLPIGFQTIAPSRLNILSRKIDTLININTRVKNGPPFLMEIATVNKIIETINQSFEYSNRWGNEGLEWNANAFKDLIKYLDDLNTDITQKGKVLIYFSKDREIIRKKSGGESFSDAPDDGKSDSRICKAAAITTPLLMLLKQKGIQTNDGNGWRDGEFYWPVFMAPQSSPTFVYTGE